MTPIPSIDNNSLPPNLQSHESGGFEYIDSGEDHERPPILLLHGLLGNPEGWFDAASALVANGYRAIVPNLKMDDLPRKQANVQGLVDYVYRFTTFLGLDEMILVGNSLGGQIAVRYITCHPKHVAGLILSASSGIYETEVGHTTFRRNDREYIRVKAEKTFYDPAMVTEELLDRISDIATNRLRALRFVWLARSSMKDLVVDELSDVNVPAFLIWGSEDQITPPDVAHMFQELLPNAKLRFIEKCGHAPMMERPEAFNQLMIEFLDRSLSKVTTPA
ncbi:MAG: alpha/beta hydrolase [Bacteroidota bacterium]|nr:alpha/beta hydrolase [Bacteroidota bacterium]MDE2645675.1 alpha/beta hydrolase [Bacteroidota bacterium]